jgi:multiple sugar transport system substrate-binding protein
MNNWKAIFFSIKFWTFCAIFLVTAGASCSIVPENKIISENITLEMWVVVDSKKDYRDIVEAYNEQFSNIKVNITKFRLEDYEQELLNALAEDKGPDIFVVHNTDVRKNISKIAPLPKEISVPRVFSSSGFNRDVVVEIETIKTISPLQLEQVFVDIVAEDVLINDEIYGLPQYVDTLALYYNRDLLNAAGFAQPPQFWSQFQDMSGQLTKINLQNEIIQSGAALGTANNVQNAPDILALLMMQTGAQMTNEKKTIATFNNAITEDDTRRNPGIEGLRFYGDFARTPPTTAYSWNEDQPDNLETFINGKLAFFFGYSYHLPLIKAQSVGKLNFSVAPMVQIQNAQPINLANYWIPTVSKKSENIDPAWHFLQFIAGSKQVPKYLSVVGRPTALRTLVDEEKNNQDIFAFAGQSLTAKNWYYGYNSDIAKKAFETMITQSILQDSDTDINKQLGKIINDASKIINQSYKK